MPPTTRRRSSTTSIGAESFANACLAHREVLNLAYYHEKSVDEIARIAGVSASTVKTRMFYARKRMERLLATAGLAD